MFCSILTLKKYHVNNKMRFMHGFLYKLPSPVKIDRGSDKAQPLFGRQKTAKIQ